jgi:hypothetical protein
MKKLLLSPENAEIFDTVMERQMNSFLVSYANFIKNKYNHHGGIFQKPFKRLHIVLDDYLRNAIIYVHTNPAKHQVKVNYKAYPHSSYTDVLNGNSYVVAVTMLLGLFGGLENFIREHDQRFPDDSLYDFPNSPPE